MSDFKWRQFEGEIILWAVRWYCRYGISYRDLEQMMLGEVLNAKPREIRALLRGQLPAGRAQELQHEMLAVGIPL